MNPKQFTQYSIDPPQSLCTLSGEYFLVKKTESVLLFTTLIEYYRKTILWSTTITWGSKTVSIFFSSIFSDRKENLVVTFKRLKFEILISFWKHREKQKKKIQKKWELLHKSIFWQNQFYFFGLTQKPKTIIYTLNFATNSLH